jgi:rRNA pseudouridine-1189 N-methylase Emg1 (Nep1/Mra1 family)
MRNIICRKVDLEVDYEQHQGENPRIFLDHPCQYVELKKKATKNHRGRTDIRTRY